MSGNAEEDDGSTGCGGAAKHPEGLGGWVVLAGIDVDEELGLGLLQRGQGKQGG